MNLLGQVRVPPNPKYSAEVVILLSTLGSKRSELNAGRLASNFMEVKRCHRKVIDFNNDARAGVDSGEDSALKRLCDIGRIQKDSEGNVALPQIFIDGWYIGKWEDLQGMEDDGILGRVLRRQVCCSCLEKKDKHMMNCFSCGHKFEELLPSDMLCMSLLSEYYGRQYTAGDLGEEDSCSENDAEARFSIYDKERRKQNKIYEPASSSPRRAVNLRKVGRPSLCAKMVQPDLPAWATEKILKPTVKEAIESTVDLYKFVPKGAAVDSDWLTGKHKLVPVVPFSEEDEPRELASAPSPAPAGPSQEELQQAVAKERQQENQVKILSALEQAIEAMEGLPDQAPEDCVEQAIDRKTATEQVRNALRGRKLTLEDVCERPEVRPSTADGPIELKGNLWKKSPNYYRMRSFQWRYFALRDSKLVWWKTEADAKVDDVPGRVLGTSKCNGYLNLESCPFTIDIDPGNETTFTVKPTSGQWPKEGCILTGDADRSFCFDATKSQHSRAHWIKFVVAASGNETIAALTGTTSLVLGKRRTRKAAKHTTK